MTKGHVRVGTSGWQYEHWKGSFYPEDLAPDDWLGVYAERFGTVEVNTTYYGMPTRETIAAWVESVPDDFTFAIKASGYITHRKKLKDPAQTLPDFLDMLEAFGETRGPVLFQLPPHWRVNPERLDQFLHELPDELPVAFEFRDPSWIVDEIRELLGEHDAAFCIYDLAGYRSPKWVTSGALAYVRLHGPGDAYEGSYEDDTLEGWREDVEAWSRDERDVFVFFDNDQRAYAVENAQRLAQRL